MKNWKTPKLKKLAQAFLKINNEKDLLNFMRDLMTLDELEEFSSRWEVVILLNKNVPYREIAKKTKVSTTTITRIAHWLNHGESGYEKALLPTKKKPKQCKC